MTTNRVRAARAGNCITPEFLARDMGRSYGRDWVEQRQEGVLHMPANPYAEIKLRAEFDKGFWQVIREVHREAFPHG
jgi:hypothetical protein